MAKPKLKLQYEDICMDYVEAFLNKHGLENKFVNWDIIGVSIFIDRKICSFNDIRYDIDNDLNVGIFESYLLSGSYCFENYIKSIQ